MNSTIRQGKPMNSSYQTREKETRDSKDLYSLITAGGKNSGTDIHFFYNSNK